MLPSHPHPNLTPPPRCSRAEGVLEEEDSARDVLVVQRNRQTVRAHEPRTGEEKWNFSVSLHDLALHPHQGVCEEEEGEVAVGEEEWSIKTVVSEGVVCAVDREEEGQVRWRRKFEAPIVDAWRVRGGGITQV